MQSSDVEYEHRFDLSTLRLLTSALKHGAT